MALLVIAALFWGNCFTCPQMLQAAAHGCCQHSKKASQDCSAQSLRNFVKADPAVQDAPAAAPIAISVQPAAAPLAELVAGPIAVVHAPPDRISLHATFRI